MKIEINDSNRADIALVFESIAETIKQQSSQTTSAAINFFKTGVIVDLEGRMKRQGPPGLPLPDKICHGRYGVLIHDGRLKVVES